MKGFELKKDDLNDVSMKIKRGELGTRTYRAITLKMKHQNYSNMEIADLLDITPRTVINICNYYQKSGLESALKDDPRPGQPIVFDDRIKSKIVALVCSNPPEAFDRWTLDIIQQKVIDNKIVPSISKEKIRIILQEHDLKPWQYDMWCIPELDEEYIKRMENILDIYEARPSKSYPVICIDEKSVQKLDNKREEISLKEGSLRKIDHEYVRKGTANVFIAVEPKKGIFHARVTESRKGDEFAKYLAQIERKYSSAKKIHLIMDNVNTHFKKSLTTFYGEKEGSRIWNRFSIHYTPVHASWLNQAEIAIGMYSRQCLGMRRISELKDLRGKTKRWVEAINSKGVTIKWKFTKKKAREKFKYK